MSKCPQTNRDREESLIKGFCKKCPDFYQKRIDKAENAVSQYPILKRKKRFDEEYFSKLREQLPSPEKVGQECDYSKPAVILDYLERGCAPLLNDILTDFSKRFPEFNVNGVMGRIKGEQSLNAIFEIFVYNYLRVDKAFKPIEAHGLCDGVLDWPKIPICVEIKYKANPKGRQEIKEWIRRGDALVVNDERINRTIENSQSLLEKAESQLLRTCKESKKLVVYGLDSMVDGEMEFLNEKELKDFFVEYPEIGAVAFFTGYSLADPPFSPIKVLINTSRDLPFSDEDVQQLMTLLHFSNSSEALVKI